MKTAVIAASLLASASAFAPAAKQASSTAMKAFENELGAQPPVSTKNRRMWRNDARGRWQASIESRLVAGNLTTHHDFSIPSITQLGFYDPFDFVTGASQEEFDRLRTRHYRRLLVGTR